MITAAPIRRDLYNQTGGRPAMGLRGGAGWDLWRNNPASNPSLQRATDDDIWIAESGRRAELARKLMAQQNARKAKEEADMLEAALNGGNANVFGEPMDEYDEDLQGVLQEHVNAGIRGVERQYSPAAMEKIRRRQIENLNLNRALRAQSLDESQFMTGLEKDQRNFNLARQKQNDQNAYRNSLLDNRLIADSRDNQTRTYERNQKMALEMVKDGMDPEEVIQLFQLNPRDQEVLRGYGGLFDEGDEEDERLRQAKLDYLNNLELGMRSPVEIKSATWGDRLMGNEPLGPSFDEVTANGPLRARLNPADPTNKDFNEALLQGAEEGFRYDPTRGFYDEPMDNEPPPPPQSLGGRKRATDPSLPLITSKAQLAEMIRSGRLKRGMRFRTYGGLEKVVN